MKRPCMVTGEEPPLATTRESLHAGQRGQKTNTSQKRSLAINGRKKWGRVGNWGGQCLCAKDTDRCLPLTEGKTWRCKKEGGGALIYIPKLARGERTKHSGTGLRQEEGLFIKVSLQALWHKGKRNQSPCLRRTGRFQVGQEGWRTIREAEDLRGFADNWPYVLEDKVE